MEEFPIKLTGKERFSRRTDRVLKDWDYARDTGRLLSSSLHSKEYRDGQNSHKKNQKQYIPKTSPAENGEISPEYKRLLDEYAKNKKDNARLQAILLEKMRTDPDFWKDPEAILNDQDFNLLDKTRDDISAVLKKCKSIYTKIEEVYSKFPNPADLYEYVFQHRPEGKVETIKGPISIYFKCFHINDYAWIYRGSSLDQANTRLTTKEIEEAKESSGCALSESSREEFREISIAERVDDKYPVWDSVSTQKHEEEHVLRAIINKTWSPEKYTKGMWITSEVVALSLEIKELVGITPASSPKALDDTSLDLIKKYLVRISKNCSFRNYVYGADEILAYFKDGECTALDTFYNLTESGLEGGLYDYFQDDIDSLKSVLSSDPKVHILIEEVLSRSREKYHDLLWYACQALLELYGTGKFSRDEIIAIFDKEPIARWPIVSQRIIQSGV